VLPTTATAGGCTKDVPRATQPLASCPLEVTLPTKPAAHSHTTAAMSDTGLSRPVKHCEGLPVMSSRLKPRASSGCQMVGSTAAMLLLARRRDRRNDRVVKFKDSSVSRLKDRDLQTHGVNGASETPQNQREKERGNSQDLQPGQPFEHVVGEHWQLVVEKVPWQRCEFCERPRASAGIHIQTHTHRPRRLVSPSNTSLCTVESWL
jgi:hypothetical protein